MNTRHLVKVLKLKSLYCQGLMTKNTQTLPHNFNYKKNKLSVTFRVRSDKLQRTCLGVDRIEQHCTVPFLLPISFSFFIDIIKATSVLGVRALSTGCKTSFTCCWCRPNIRGYLPQIMNVCIRFNGDPLSGVWEFSHWTTALDWLICWLQ